MYVDVAVLGDKQFSRELLRIGARSQNLNPVFRSVFLQMMEINSEQMRSHGARGGEPYAPLKPETVAAKARAGLDLDPLFATHDLFNAMASLDGGNNEAVYNETWAVWQVTGEPAIYGPVHQAGTRDGSIPARPPFKLLEVDKVAFVKEMQRFIMTGELAMFL